MILKKCAALGAFLFISVSAQGGPPSISAAVCQSNLSDGNGDGWGWENGASCVVSDAPATQRAHPVCRPGTEDSDGNGWAVQEGVSCLVIRTTAANENSPTSNARPSCESASSDSDGDGWGYENGATCIVARLSLSTDDSGNQQEVSGSTVIRAGVARPVCEFASSDPDGDGWGLENAASCVVTESSVPLPEENSSTETATDETSAANSEPETPLQVITANTNNSPACGSSLSDLDGDGFGFEGGRSCVITPASRAFPVCLSAYSDLDGNGYGFENRKSCIVVEGVSATNDNLLLATPMCDSWAQIGYGNYRIQNNTWNATVMNDHSWSQCIELNIRNDRPVVRWDFDWLNPEDGDLTQVKSYPQVYYGRKTERNTSGPAEEIGLPQIVNRLSDFKVDYNWSATGDAEYNVALESFFHESCEANHDNKEFEMMVWVGLPETKTPGVYVTSATIDGKRWGVYANPNLNWGYVAFFAEEESNSGTLNWNRFVEWSRDNSEAYGLGELRSGSCMGAIEIGTETFWGEGEFTLHQFDVRFD